MHASDKISASRWPDARSQPLDRGRDSCKDCSASKRCKETGWRAMVQLIEFSACGPNGQPLRAWMNLVYLAPGDETDDETEEVVKGVTDAAGCVALEVPDSARPQHLIGVPV